MATRTQVEAQGNGRTAARRAGDLALEPPPARRRVRIPELLIGAALTVGFALAAVLWQANSSQREAALALATDIDRGETVEADDLRVVYIGTDDAVLSLAPSQAATVVGRPAAVDLRVGTLMTRTGVTDVAPLQPGEGVVGLALDPGQFPATRLAPGDVVNVVGPGDRDADLLAEGAIVFAVEDLGGQGRRFVSIRASEEDANRVAAAAERGPVRLVLVGR